MALSRSIEAGRRSPAVYRLGTPAVSLPPPAAESTFLFSERFVKPETFRQLAGDVQEVVLLTLLKGQNLARFNELRPDMQVYQALSEDELTVGLLVRGITKRNQPVTAPSPADHTQDTAFAQLYNLVSVNPGEGRKQTKQELIDILEEERKRATVEYPNYLFSPAKDIGSFTAARRYLANLTFAVNPRLYESTLVSVERQTEGLVAQGVDLFVPGVPLS